MKRMTAKQRTHHMRRANRSLRRRHVAKRRRVATHERRLAARRRYLDEDTSAVHDAAHDDPSGLRGMIRRVARTMGVTGRISI